MGASRNRAPALVISPFSFIPADAGHRRRVLQSLSFLDPENMTFVLYAFESGWIYNHKPDVLEEMRRIVPDVLVYRGRLDIGAPPQSGNHHHLDEWYDEGFESFLKNLISFRSFDCVVAHNVWMSKYIDFLPPRTTRILELHDIFSLRTAAFDKLQAPPEFFIASKADEIFGIDRADIAITIQQHDNKWVAKNTMATPVCIPYAAPDSDTPLAVTGYLSSDTVTFGFLGTSHSFNVHGINLLIEQLGLLIGATYAPIKLVVAGSVCNHLPEEAAPWWTALGYVEKEEDFFNAVDIVVTPIDGGTGFKVKVADTAASGKPLLVTAHAAIGSSVPHELVTADIGKLAEKMVAFSFERPDLGAISNALLSRDRELRGRIDAAVDTFQKALDERRHVFVFDLSGVPDELACTCFAGLLRGLRFTLDVGWPIVVTQSPDVAAAAAQISNGPRILTKRLTPADLPPGNVLWITVDPSGAVPDQLEPAIHRLEPEEVVHTGVFGDNRAWDPAFKEALKRQSRKAKAEYGGTVLLIDNDQTSTVNSLPLTLAANEMRHSCVAQNLSDLAGLVSSIIEGQVTEIMCLTAQRHWSAELVLRLAESSGVRVTSLAMRKSVTDADVNAFWTAALTPTGRPAANIGQVVDVDFNQVVDLSYLSRISGGIHEPEFYEDDRPMAWASGLQPLALCLHGVPDGEVRLNLIGHTSGEHGQVELICGDGEGQIIDVTGDYEEHQIALPADADRSGGHLDLVLRFPPGVDIAEIIEGPVPEERRRTLSFLIYKLWFDAPDPL